MKINMTKEQANEYYDQLQSDSTDMRFEISLIVESLQKISECTEISWRRNVDVLVGAESILRKLEKRLAKHSEALDCVNRPLVAGSPKGAIRNVGFANSEAESSNFLD